MWVMATHIGVGLVRLDVWLGLCVAPGHKPVRCVVPGRLPSYPLFGIVALARAIC
jgi:hypothetical protein